MIKEAVEKNVYHASLKPEKSDVFIITVPTPYIKENEKVGFKLCDNRL